MPKRYKTLHFKEFDGKTNQDFIDKLDLSKSKYQFGLKPNDLNGRIELTKNYNSQAFITSKGAYYSNLLAVHGNSTPTNLFFLKYLSSSEPVLYKRQFGGTFTSLFTFPAGTSIAYALISFKNKLIAFTVNITNKVSYSTNDGTSFTHDDWAYSVYRGHLLGSDGYLYVYDSAGSVIRTLDGITWELFYNGSSVDSFITQMIELDGYFYFILNSQNLNTNHFVKYSSGEMEFIKTFENQVYLATIYKFNNKIYISNYSDSKIKIYEYDKIDVQLFAVLDQLVYTGICFHYSDDYNLYFSASTTSETRRLLFSMNRNGCISFLKDFGTGEEVCQILSFNGKLVIFSYYVSGSTYTTHVYDNIDSESSFDGSAYLLLPIIDFRHKPCYIETRHPKMPSGCYYTIQANINYATTDYSTTLVSNNTTGSIGKLSDLRKLITGDVQFVELILFITDSNKAFAIKDFTFDYIYIETGLQNH